MVQWLRNLFGSRQPTPLRGGQAAAGKASTVAAPVAGPVPEPLAAIPAPPVTEAAATPVAPGEPKKIVAAPSGISWLAREDVNANFTGWLFARSDYSDLQTSNAERDVLKTLDEILESPQSGAQLVRRMPGVIPQVLQSLRTNDFSGAELSRKISHDVVLVAEVIRIANSSMYAKQEPISSIEHAVLVLGQNGLRHLITSVAFRPIVDLKSGHFNRLIAPRIWSHSQQCALAARLLAQQAGLNSFDAFLAGLIQNVGLIVALRVMDQVAAGSPALGSAAFCNALIPKARRLSASIGREWNFPVEVVVAIDEQAIVDRNTTLSVLGKNLLMADYLSKLNLLTQQGRQEPDVSATDGLSASELDCYVELQALTVPLAVE